MFSVSVLYNPIFHIQFLLNKSYFVDIYVHLFNFKRYFFFSPDTSLRTIPDCESVYYIFLL